MSLKKHGIVVACEDCNYTSSNSRGSFDISVPMIDSETGISGPARLRCVVSTQSHAVELLEWRDTDVRCNQSTGDIQQRVTAALSFVAERKVCGKRKICPSEVIRIVEANEKS